MKRPNPTGSENFQITISSRSARILDEIAKNGIWGKNRAEVAARFVDRALEEFVERPKLKLPPLKVRGGGD